MAKSQLKFSKVKVFCPWDNVMFETVYYKSSPNKKGANVSPIQCPHCKRLISQENIR